MDISFWQQQFQPSPPSTVPFPQQNWPACHLWTTHHAFLHPLRMLLPPVFPWKSVFLPQTLTFLHSPWVLLCPAGDRNCLPLGDPPASPCSALSSVRESPRSSFPLPALGHLSSGGMRVWRLKLEFLLPHIPYTTKDVSRDSGNICGW